MQLWDVPKPPPCPPTAGFPLHALLSLPPPFPGISRAFSHTSFFSSFSSFLFVRSCKCPPPPHDSFHDSTPSPPTIHPLHLLRLDFVRLLRSPRSSLLRRRVFFRLTLRPSWVFPLSVDISTDLYAFVVSPEHSSLFESTLLTHPDFQPFPGCPISPFVKLDHLSQWCKWLSSSSSIALGPSLTPDCNTARARKSTSMSWSSATSTAASLLAQVSPPSEAEFALPLALTNRFLVG